MEQKTTTQQHNTLLCTIVSFSNWKDQQHKTNMGGKVMYDVKGHYTYLYEHQLFEYWCNIREQHK